MHVYREFTVGTAVNSGCRRDPDVGSPVSKKKKKKNRFRSWEAVRSDIPINERAVAAVERLMGAETLLYELWDRRGAGMNWVGEALGFPIEDQGVLWVAGLGEKIAALGRHLELTAVFPDETITLVREPGPEGTSDGAP